MAVRNGASAKLDQPRLVGVKTEPEPARRCLEIGKEPLRVVLVLEADDGVIRIAHDDHVAGRASLPPLVDPQIVDVVEVDVRQERADHRALRRPFLRLDQCPLFEHTCL